MITPEQARELARDAVSLAEADEAEALVIAEHSALTRFANNRINQNVVEDDTRVSVRAVLGTRVGVSSTNRIDRDSIAECCAAAVAAARIAPDDPKFPGLPRPEPIETRDRAARSALAFGEDARADAVAAIVDESRARDLVAAGKVRLGVQTVAVANSHGVDAGMATADVQATVLSMHATGSGWASYMGASPEGLDAARLGEQAADLAVRSANPVDLAPGPYQVVLAPEAVADLMDFLAYVGFSAKAFAEGRSFLSGKLGTHVMSEQITVVDDALAVHALGLTFDFEGAPKRRTSLVDRGVAVGPVTDSYWAVQTGRANTGHALPAPNPWGPMPLNLEMLPGDATLDGLVASVDRGVYVTRFHYVNVEDPVPVTLTGMTRDGTFLIENGELTRPLKNLRFTQSAVEALKPRKARRSCLACCWGASRSPARRRSWGCVPTGGVG